MDVLGGPVPEVRCSDPGAGGDSPWMRPRLLILGAHVVQMVLQAFQGHTGETVTGDTGLCWFTWAGKSFPGGCSSAQSLSSTQRSRGIWDVPRGARAMFHLTEASWPVGEDRAIRSTGC